MTSNDPRTDTYRSELIQAISLLEKLGIIDFNGHFSTRLSDENILINTGASVRCNLSDNDFVIVDKSGNIAEGDPKPPAELPLHLAVYDSRPDVSSVVHCHPKWSTLLSSTGNLYQVTMPQGALLGDVPVFDSPMSVNNEKIASAVAKKLGTGKAVLLKAHGSVLTGNDILEATVLAIYLELNAERQVQGQLLGTPYVFNNEEAESLRKGLYKRGLFEKCWNFYIEKFNL
jgi:L-fuculose-phosphate aldolase